MGAPSVLVVCLDAMDERLARDLARRGHMPVLARLLANGSLAPTEGPPGFYVGGIWPTISTSVNPGRHGQFCYLQFDPESYEEVPPPHDDGEGCAFWRSVDQAGLRALVVDVPRSICGPLQHGLSIHDFATHDPLAPGFVTWPPELAKQVRSVAGEADLDLCDAWPKSTAAEVSACLARVADRIGRKTRLFLDLLHEGDYELAVLGFGDAHCAGHQFWHLHDPAHRRSAPEILERVGDPVEWVYERLDRALGEAIAAVPETCRILVVLSHGMALHHDGSHLLDTLLARLEPALPRLRPLTPAERWMHWRPTRNLAALFARGLRRQFPRLSVRGAFTVLNNEAWAGIRLNQVGRERRGRVRPEEREATLELLARTLMDMRNPASGTPAFSRVERVADIAHGSRLTSLPDLVACWRRDAPFDALESPGLGRVEQRCNAHRTGDHRPAGLAILAGMGVPPGTLPQTTGCADIAPTICDWLGVTMPEADGRPIEAWRAAGPSPASSVGA